jgi:hypothetical protein
MALERSPYCEVNFNRQSCFAESGRVWFNSANENESQVLLNLRCEDGSTVTSRHPIALPFTAVRLSYDSSTCSVSYSRSDDPRTVITMPDSSKRIATGITETYWKVPADADATLAELRQYDRSRTVLRSYDSGGVLSAYVPLAGPEYRELVNEFPHMSARVKWAADEMYAAHVQVFPGAGNRPDAQGRIPQLRNPIIIGDAFDPGDSRNAVDIARSERYRKLLSLDPADGGPRSAPGGGRDVVFVNFTQGGGDLLVNAHLFLRAYEWLLGLTPDSVTVAGISMSGVVARLALLYSDPANNVHAQNLGARVRGFLSVDSPQQGASIGPRLQQIACQFAAKRADAGIENWNQLSVPGAYQMLYGHYDRSVSSDCTDFKWDTSVHDRFYALLSELSRTSLFNPKKPGYRGDIPSVAIAYSNFHQAHDGGWSPDVRNVVGKTDPPGYDARDWFAGGPAGDPHRFELYPGSAGDWYWSAYSRKSPTYSYPVVCNGETFQGTFIPIQSALDLSSSFNVLDPALARTVPWRVLRKASRFDQVYIMADPVTGAAGYNDYEREFKNKPGHVPGADDRRYQHVVFDRMLMNAIRSGLADIDRAASVRSLGTSANGDGAADVLFYEPTDQTLHVNVSRGTGLWGDGTGRWASSGSVGGNGRYAVGDFDGDGFSDIAYFDTALDQVRVTLSTGRAYFRRDVEVWSSMSAWGPLNSAWHVGDFNGDGRDDFFIFDTPRKAGKIALSTGARFGAPGSGEWFGPNGFGWHPAHHRVGDFNGDGRSDIGYFESADDTFHVTLSTGAGLWAPGSGRWAANGAAGSIYGQRYVGDFNGDGRSDLLFHDGADQSYWVALSTGKSLWARDSGQWIPPGGFATSTNEIVGDFDGDGADDLAWPASDHTLRVRLSDRVSFAKPGGGVWLGPRQFGGDWGRYYAVGD